MNYLQNYHGLGGSVKKSCKIGLERGAKKIQANAKYLAPIGTTGHLRNSIKTKSQETSNGAESQVYTNLDYAPYVEFRYTVKEEKKAI